MMLSDKLRQAIENYKSGDESAFTIIYEESESYLYKCVKNIVYKGDNEVIRDILQEAYVDISKDINKLDNVDSFLSWAKTIAVRKAYKICGKNDKYVLLDEDENLQNTLIDDNKLPEEIVIDKEKQKKVRDALNDLNADERACIINYYYNEMKQKDIADKLNISNSAVKVNIFRAKEKIRNILGGALAVVAVAGLLLLLTNDNIVNKALRKSVINNKENINENGTQYATYVYSDFNENDRIPDGGVYYRAGGTVIITGEGSFPNRPQENDKYQYGDYVYTYIREENYDIPTFRWKVDIRDNSKESYGPILSTLVGVKIIELDDTFEGCYNLKEIPQLPDDIISMNETFRGCTSLEIIEKLPTSLRVMENTFENCTALKTVNHFPDELISINGAFKGCTALANVPIVNEKIIYVNETFYGCKSLKNISLVKLENKYMYRTFVGCESLINKPEIPQDSKNHKEVYEEIKTEGIIVG